MEKHTTRTRTQTRIQFLCTKPDRMRIDLSSAGHLRFPRRTENVPLYPLLISTDHHGTRDGNPLHISFLDVSVKLTGSEKWINAQ